ncbi:MAG: hypothetical protein QXS07_00365, partial [Candidatus Pacearchaeota archaeon]
MAFICDDCGLERLDEDRHEVIDGIKIKSVCSACLKPNQLLLSQPDKDEIDRKLLLAYRPKRFGEPKLSLKPKTPEDEFRRRLRQARIEQGLTVQRLGELININPRDLELFEKGFKEDIYIRKKLMDFFGIYPAGVVKKVERS